MSFSRPFQWYHSHANLIWPDGTFNTVLKSTKSRELFAFDFSSSSSTTAPDLCILLRPNFFEIVAKIFYYTGQQQR